MTRPPLFLLARGAFFSLGGRFFTVQGCSQTEAKTARIARLPGRSLCPYPGPSGTLDCLLYARLGSCQIAQNARTKRRPDAAQALPRRCRFGRLSALEGASGQAPLQASHIYYNYIRTARIGPRQPLSAASSLCISRDTGYS